MTLLSIAHFFSNIAKRFARISSRVIGLEPPSLALIDVFFGAGFLEATPPPPPGAARASNSFFSLYRWLDELWQPPIVLTTPFCRVYEDAPALFLEVLMERERLSMLRTLVLQKSSATAKVSSSYAPLHGMPDLGPGFGL